MEPGSIAFNFVIFVIACAVGAVLVGAMVKVLLRSHGVSPENPSRH